MRPASTMQALVDTYLAARRSMGFALRIDGRQLCAFARFADRTGHRGPLTVAVAVSCATRSCAAPWSVVTSSMRSIRSSMCCPPMSVTPGSPTRTGTSPRSPSSWLWLRSDSRHIGKEVRCEDRLLHGPSRRRPAGVLPGTTRRPAQCQPANRGGVPRQLPSAPAVCTATRRQSTRTP